MGNKYPGATVGIQITRIHALRRTLLAGLGAVSSVAVLAATADDTTANNQQGIGGTVPTQEHMRVAALPRSPAAEPVRLAEDAKRRFDIPPQSLSSALVQFGQQSGLQVSLDPTVVEGMTTLGIVDTQTSRYALGRILRGSGLTSNISGQTVVIAQANTGTATDADLGTINVQGQGEATTTTGSEEKSYGVPAIVIGPQQIDNAIDVQDLFIEEPSVSVGSSIPISQKIYVRGIEETNLAVTIDGARQNNKIFHHNATNLIDPALLKVVRVDPGVAPADAGPGALAGAILFETKDVRDLLEQGRSAGAFVKGGYDTNSNSLTTAGSAYMAGGGFEILGYYNRINGDDYKDGDGDTVLGSAADLNSGLAKFAYEAQSGDRFELAYEKVHDKGDRPYRANFRSLTPPRPFEPLLRPFDLERDNLVFTYTDETPHGWWDPKVVIARSGSDLYVPYTLRNGAEIDSYGTTESFSAKAENNFATRLGDVVAGVDFYDDYSRFRDQFDRVEESADNIGFYAQARLEFHERVRVSFGGRHDSQDFTGTDGSKLDNSGFSGNASGEIDVTRNITINGGASHIFGGIPLAEPYIMNPIWSYNNVVPVEADNVVAGVETRHGIFTFTASVFRTEIDNAQAPEYGSFLGTTGRDVRHDLVSKGYELGADAVWETGRAGVRFASIDVTEDGGPLTSDAQYLATPVGDILSLFLQKRIPNTNVTVGGDVQIAFKYDDFAGESVEGTTLLPLQGYEVVNVFAEYKPERFQGLTLRAEVNNVFDESYADRASYGGEFTDVLEQLLEPGRSFYVSATRKF